MNKRRRSGKRARPHTSMRYTPRSGEPPKIQIKTPQQIDKMRPASAVVVTVLQACAKACVPGVTTAEVNQIARQLTAEHKAKALFLNYPSWSGVPSFPAETCISVNEVIVHGIPGDYVLKENDIVSIDYGAEIDGWCGDSAVTVLVGDDPAKDLQVLCEGGLAVLEEGIKSVRPGQWWGVIAARMEKLAVRGGYGVIRDFVGHGIGQKLHEPPELPNFTSRETEKRNFQLKAGMVLAIEPMIAAGTGKTETLDDGWSVVTRDRKPAVHFEHTVAVTDGGCEVLTAGALVPC